MLIGVILTILKRSNSESNVASFHLRQNNGQNVMQMFIFHVTQITNAAAAELIFIFIRFNERRMAWKTI